MTGHVSRFERPRLQVDVPALLDALGIVVTKRERRSLYALCPYHDDKSPNSWSIVDDPTSSRNGFNYCLAGETKVKTWDGDVPISELAGRTVKILSNSGTSPAWVEAPFRSFGVQRLWAVKISRNGVEKTIRATAEHRWFVRGSHGSWDKYRELTTSHLKPGHFLRTAGYARSGMLAPSPWGIPHGVVFGDGTKSRSIGSKVVLWGEKDAVLRKWFPYSPSRPVSTENGVKGEEIWGLPSGFKDLPLLNESSSYLYGWLAGYFAADGCVDDGGLPKLASASREHLEFVRVVCARLGILTHGITTQMRTGLGDEETALYSVSFSRAALNEAFFLIDEHRARWLAGRDVKERIGWVVVSVVETAISEEVFCATVPESHCFSLEDNLMTGNCFSCEEGGGPLALVKKVKGIDDTLDALDWLKFGSLERELPLEIDVVVGSYRAGANLAMRVPQEVKIRELESWPSGARRYLEERGISASQVIRFDIGFAIEGRLKGRIVFPMKNRDGRVVSYTARDFTGQQKRYLEPKTDEGALKGALFGEHLWNNAQSKILIVAEGCPDALALDRVVLKLDNRPLYDVCAMHGSNLHPTQAAKFSRYQTIVVATDPDSAGDRVAQDIDEALSRYCRVVRARPPEKQDCGSMDPNELFWMIAASLDTEGCVGCGAPSCRALWTQGKKCCPDCSHG